VQLSQTTIGEAIAMQLSLEKNFTHIIFCQQVDSLNAEDLDNAKQLLKDLHLLYVGQQALFSQLAKQSFAAQPNLFKGQAEGFNPDEKKPII
jgi:hypothetical protein